LSGYLIAETKKPLNLLRPERFSVYISSEVVRLPPQVLQRLYLCVQTALVPCRFVFVHQALTRHTIKNRYGRLVCIARRLLVASFNRANHTFYVSTHHRAHTHIAGTSVFCLAGTFFCLGRVRQVSLQKESKIEPGSIVRDLSVVNRQKVRISSKNKVFRSLEPQLVAKATVA